MPADADLPTGSRVVGTIHCHGGFAAFSSSVDEDDEAELDGLHVVVGDLDPSTSELRRGDRRRRRPLRPTQSVAPRAASASGRAARRLAREGHGGAAAATRSDGTVRGDPAREPAPGVGVHARPRAGTSSTTCSPRPTESRPRSGFDSTFWLTPVSPTGGARSESSHERADRPHRLRRDREPAAPAARPLSRAAGRNRDRSSSSSTATSSRPATGSRQACEPGGSGLATRPRPWPGSRETSGLAVRGDPGVRRRGQRPVHRPRGRHRPPRGRQPPGAGPRRPARRLARGGDAHQRRQRRDGRQRPARPPPGRLLGRRPSRRDPPGDRRGGRARGAPGPRLRGPRGRAAPAPRDEPYRRSAMLALPLAAPRARQRPLQRGLPRRGPARGTPAPLVPRRRTARSRAVWLHPQVHNRFGRGGAPFAGASPAELHQQRHREVGPMNRSTNPPTESLANPFRPGNGVAPPYLAGRDPLLEAFDGLPRRAAAPCQLDPHRPARHRQDRAARRVRRTGRTRRLGRPSRASSANATATTPASPTRSRRTSTPSAGASRRWPRSARRSRTACARCARGVSRSASSATSPRTTTALRRGRRPDARRARRARRSAPAAPIAPARSSSTTRPTCSPTIAAASATRSRRSSRRLGHVQRAEPRVRVVLCGLPTLSLNLKRARTYAERMFRHVVVGNLEPGDAVDCADGPARRRAAARSRAALTDEIVETTGGVSVLPAVRE